MSNIVHSLGEHATIVASTHQSFDDIYCTQFAEFAKHVIQPIELRTPFRGEFWDWTPGFATAWIEYM